MSETIYRQEAIDACTKAKVGAFPHDAGVNNSIEALKALPSAQPEQRWIPVDKRLPDTEHDDILVTYIDQFGTYVGQDEYQYGEFLYYGDKVIAWMPMPDPWDGGQKE